MKLILTLSLFSLHYIKGVPPENVNATLSIEVNGNTVIGDIGVYHIALSQQTATSSSIITVNLRLSANSNAAATGGIEIE